jgi:hypothetical protein
LRFDVLVLSRVVVILERPVMQFTIGCPRCDNVSGLPITASTRQEGGVVVLLRCRDCAHEWQCILPAPAPELQPKPDRRHLADSTTARKK